MAIGVVDLAIGNFVRVEDVFAKLTWNLEKCCFYFYNGLSRIFCHSLGHCNKMLELCNGNG